jgi:RNA polymerase sigma factor (sigma-70 family)
MMSPSGMVNQSDPIRIVSRVKNNRLVLAQKEAGLSGKEMADLLGICQTTYYRYASCRRHPSQQTLDRMASKNGSDYIEYLFPDYLRRITKSVSERTVSEERFLRISAQEVKELADSTQDPYDRVVRMEVSDLIERAMERLSARDAEVVRLYHGMGCARMTYRAIADLYMISPERVRQILARAMRRLRHPGAPVPLRPALDMLK